MAEKKVVWILGAGFSVPLGGPLFRELISAETLRQLLYWQEYTRTTWTGHWPLEPGRWDGDPIDAGVSARIVTWLYEAGLGNDDGSGRLWADAEQFLERLEIATRETPSQLTKDIRERIGSSTRGKPRGDGFISRAVQCFQMEKGPEGKPGLERLYPEAVRFVAGACSQFLWRAEQNPKIVDESEQWDPYRRWALSLEGGKDTVITFNYDRSLDILAEHCRRQEKTDNLVSPVGVSEEKFKAQGKSCVRAFHLHGHVSWQRAADGKSIEVQPLRDGFQVHPAVAHNAPATAVIGVPGAGKLSLPEGLLKFSWDQAMDAITQATSVVFVGYRFPETDNMAKRCLIDALKKKSGRAGPRRVGHQQPGPTTTRRHDRLDARSELQPGASPRAVGSGLLRRVRA